MIYPYHSHLQLCIYISGKRKASVVDNVDSPRERKRARDESEPAEEEESGPLAP